MKDNRKHALLLDDEEGYLHDIGLLLAEYEIHRYRNFGNAMTVAGALKCFSAVIIGSRAGAEEDGLLLKLNLAAAIVPDPKRIILFAGSEPSEEAANRADAVVRKPDLASLAEEVRRAA